MHRYQQTREALGSTVLLTLVDSANPSVIDSYFTTMWDMVRQFESRFSRFIKTSELTYFNYNSGKRTVISPQFHDLLVTSKKLATKTDGIYTPFILPALQHAGYKGSWPYPSLVEDDLDYSDRIVESYKNLHISKAWAEIPNNTAIEFGGVGKGYLLDELASYLGNKVVGFWFSLGGDIICNGSDVDQQAWQIGVQHALNPDVNIIPISNKDRATLAIATSGITKRRGDNENKKWHHIIDPRSLKPADTDVVTATVYMRQAVIADVYAKCAVILGADEAYTFLYNDSDVLGAILQTNNATKPVIMIDKTAEAHKDKQRV